MVYLTEVRAPPCEGIAFDCSSAISTDVIRDFFKQPATRYRNFQLVFTVLTLNFLIPALVYTFAPLIAHEQFNQLNLMLGGYPYYFPEDQSIFYRVLGAANVFALAFMCAFLQWNLRKHIIALVPLVFLKMTAATIWLVAYIQRPLLPASLGACVLDAVTSVLFIFFAVRAYREIQDVPDDQLVPKPKRSIIHRIEKSS